MTQPGLRNLVLIVVAALIAFAGLFVIATRWSSSDGPGSAELATAWQDELESRIRFVSAATALGEGTVMLGLELRMTQGWKTYWRNPGDSGFAPQFDWSASDNVRDVEIVWPAPQAFDEAGERYYGYKDHVLWPLRVTAHDAATPAHLVLTLNYGVCADVCVPARAHLKIAIPAGAASPTTGASLITAAMKQAPADAEAINFTPEVTLTNVVASRAALHIAPGEGDFQPTLAIVSGQPGPYFGASKPFEENGFLVPVDSADPETLRGTTVNLVLRSADGRAAEGNFLIQ